MIMTMTGTSALQTWLKLTEAYLNDVLPNNNNNNDDDDDDDDYL